MTIVETVGLTVMAYIGEGWEVVADSCLIAILSAAPIAIPFTIGESGVVFLEDENREALCKAVWKDVGLFIAKAVVAPIGGGSGEYSSEQAKWAAIGAVIGTSVVKQFVEKEPSIKYYRG